ncbi:hypothetical protein POTOM_054929 [Populus tomentosa]|uniref:Uncharacterized protein n=1 Tax=Populus tomentosa TaxID=118781 RepID=A0A8X8C591_POPTO|nr:hypothetical protein POTOM_054929 [Populus tomentosa]
MAVEAALEMGVVVLLVMGLCCLSCLGRRGSACEGEREIVAEGLWLLRRRWVARSVGLAGTPLLGGGADGKNQGEKGSEGLKVCVGLGEKQEEVGEAVAAEGLGFSS